MNQNTEELSPLNELFLKSKRNVHIVALILDCTANYKTQNDYLTRIKIIDDTFNSVENPNLKNGFFEVCQFSSSVNKCPRVWKIGDIIYLRKYNVTAQDEKRLQIETNHKAKCSYHIFDSEQNNFEIFDSDYDGQFEVTPQLKLRIGQLRSYCFQLFSNTSLMRMIWFGLQPNQENQVTKKDFDLLLSIQEIEQVDGVDSRLEQAGMVRLILIDSDNNKYFLTFQDRRFSKGQIVKIRSVRYIDDNGQIVKNDYSNVLKLSSFFYDFKNFKEVKYDLIEYYKTNYDFEMYVADPNDQYRKFSVLKKIHSSNNIITPLQELLRYQANPQLFSTIRTQKFKIQCYFIDVHPKNLGEAVKKVSYMDQNIYYPLQDFSDFNKDNDLKRILEVQMVVKDQSIDLSSQIVQLVLIQEEKEKHDFYKGVSLTNINENNIEEYQQTFDQINNRLFQYTTNNRTVDIVVQPILYQGKILFRIIDTQFIP